MLDYFGNLFKFEQGEMQYVIDSFPTKVTTQDNAKLLRPLSADEVNQRRRNTKKKTSQVPPTAQQPVAAQVPQSAQELAAAPLPQSAQQPATAQGSLIEEIQHFWNEAERVASLFDIQVGVHPQLEEITITQPRVDITQNLESQSAAEVTNSKPTPKSIQYAMNFWFIDSMFILVNLQDLLMYAIFV
nr:salivary glue protein Sgs-3-like [Ipomoea batatas]